MNKSMIMRFIIMVFVANIIAVASMAQGVKGTVADTNGQPRI